MKLTATKSSSEHVVITMIICAVIVILTFIAAVSIINLNNANNMAKNIDAAISKGVDPLSVKCSYETKPSGTCIAYAVGKK